MAKLRVTLFGMFGVSCDDRPIAGMEARKVQELFAYLLLHRGRPHPRETLAALLWGESAGVDTKKGLRQTLWQLQTAMEAAGSGQVLLVEADGVQVNPACVIALDVAALEQANLAARGVAGPAMDRRQAEELQRAAEAYTGDLLEGWYHDWCLFERERLQQIYLGLLDKLMGYCEAHEEYEAGLGHGANILRYDLARERTHRGLMRMHYLCGDRTAAIRQYQRCVSLLDAELGVAPADRTVLLYDLICADAPLGALGEDPAPKGGPLPGELLDRLSGLQVAIADLQRRLEREIQAVRVAIQR